MSNAERIGTAIKSAVEALALAGVTEVTIRKAPTLPQGAAVPQVIIVVAEGTPAERLFADQWMVMYEASIIYVTTGGEKLGEDTTLRTIRVALETLVIDDETYEDVPGFNVANPRGTPAYNPAALNALYNYTTVTATVEVEETR